MFLSVYYYRIWDWILNVQMPLTKHTYRQEHQLTRQQ